MHLALAGTGVCNQSQHGRISQATKNNHKVLENMHGNARSAGYETDSTFYLMELCKMCFVNGFVSEHPVYREVLGRPESLLS